MDCTTCRHARRQTDLFGERGLEPKQQAVAREKREQEKNLRRVHKSLRSRIETFIGITKMRKDRMFTAAELHEAVGAAPASADRILRLLRQDGHLNYRVVDRARSLYEVLP